MSARETAQVLGKYAIVRELGRGGFATVYLAQDTILRRSVALKILHPVLLTDPTFVQRFEQEAHATAQLDHPHIATIFDLGQLEGRLYIAMRLLPGGTLADRIKQGGALPFAEAARAIGEIGGALDHAHAAGFVHRDVKPTNILFDQRGAAVLADFGMVKAVEGSVIARTTMGAVIGTPAYIAPEVWEGKESGPAADVYALGCVLFGMLTGELLFKGSTPPAVMLAHFRPHEYPAQWPAGTPPQLSGVLEQALARDPAERYAGADAFIDALHGLSARPADPPPPPDRVQDEQARLAAQWRDAALEAEQAGQIDAARAAARRWLELAPGDAEAQALLEPPRVAEEYQRESFVRPSAVPQEAGDDTTAAVTGVEELTEPPAPDAGHTTSLIQTIWRPIGLIAIGWAIAGAFDGEVFGFLSGGSSLLWLIGAMVRALSTGFALQWVAPSLPRKQILFTATTWAILGGLGFGLTGLIGCATGALLTGLTFRLTLPLLEWSQVLRIILIWPCAALIGMILAGSLFQGLLGGILSYNAAFGAGFGAVTGAIGGGVMFWVISKALRKAGPGA